MRALGIYRETEFSPGKATDDAAILDAVLAHLKGSGIETTAIQPRDLADRRFSPNPDLILAMCQGEKALEKLAVLEEAGALAINSALAIRNCYRDLLGSGLLRAGVPSPRGMLIDTGTELSSLRLGEIDPARGVYVKRGDLHALSPGDVQRVNGFEEFGASLLSFRKRGVKLAYVQQAVNGTLVKFYGVSGGEYFAALPEEEEFPDQALRKLRHGAEQAAEALGLEVWGGDAVFTGDHVTIIDFNDWPSYSRVRKEAARAIARRATMLMRRPRHLSDE